MLLLSLTYIILGFVFLVWGADRLIEGASAMARNLGVSPLIVGLTVVGFGTSAPELVVSGVASLRGSPGLAVGNAIGSNIANIGLILGITALVRPLQVESSTLKREYPLFMVVTLASLAFLWDAKLMRFEGTILLGGLLMTTAWMVYIGMKRGDKDPLAQEFAAEIPTGVSNGRAMWWVALGMVVLPASSHVLVIGAIDVAQHFGVTDTVIGLTIVALGTSLPELAAGISSVLKNEDDIAIGNIIGSNMFNLLGVLGIVGLIHPTVLPVATVERDFMVMLALSVLLYMMAYGFRGPGRIGRLSALLLLTVFCGYMVWLFDSEIRLV